MVAVRADLDALRCEILAELEPRLLETLLRRGHAEVQKLQQDGQELRQSVDQLKGLQEELRASLAEMTSRFEVVERRLGAEASTARCYEAHPAPMLPHLPTWTQCVFEAPELDAPHFATPPRKQGAETVAVLSLASALSSDGCKSAPGRLGRRLQLAEVLPQAEPAMPPVASGDSTPRSASVISVSLRKEPGFWTLGVDVKQVEPAHLRVNAIDTHGLVGQHNARHIGDTAAQVLKGDLITAVNGVHGDSDQMLEECKTSQHLEFAIERRGADLSHDSASSGDETVTTATSERPGAPQFNPDASVFVPACMLPPGLGISAPVDTAVPTQSGPQASHTMSRSS